MRKENSMKKKILRVLLLILILVLLFLIIRSTYSKYYNSASGIINENAGAWIIKVNGTDIGEGGGTFDIEEFNIDDEYGEHIEGEQIAPGTKGRFYIELDPTGTQVSLEYTISIDKYTFISNIMNAIGLDPTNEDDRSKINIKITDIKVNDTSIPLTGNEEDEIVFSKIKKLSSIQSTEESDRVDIIEVEIEWENNEANNEVDALIGNLEDYKFTLPVTVNAIQWYE